MPGLNIIVAGAEAARLYAALETAMAAAALGRAVRVFLQGEAVALLCQPIGFSGDDARRAAGQPDLAQLIEEAAAMRIGLIVCQSGIALAGVTMAELVPNVRAGGLVSFLAEAALDDALLAY